MNTSIIKELIDNSDLLKIQKNLMKGFVDRANNHQEQTDEDRQLIQQVANEKKVDEIILSTDEVKIYTVYGKEDYEIKYPFRSIYFKDGIWQRVSTVSPSLDIAYLNYLQYKYLGLNNQFADFAIKMLEIKLEE